MSARASDSERATVRRWTPGPYCDTSRNCSAVTVSKRSWSETPPPLCTLPPTTVDIDFFFCKTPANVKKLKAVAAELKGSILRAFYPADDLFRIMRDQDTLQVDYLPTVAGLSSFEGVRKRASQVEFDGFPVYVASLADIIKSKKAAGRPKDLAVMYVLESTLAERRITRKKKLDALKKESELSDREMIRRLLALPPERRTHFLRVRVGILATCL